MIYTLSICTQLHVDFDEGDITTAHIFFRSFSTQPTVQALAISFIPSKKE